MKIKINVVNDSSSVKDNDLTEYRGSIKPSPFDAPLLKYERSSGEAPKPGDLLLIKIEDELYKLEIAQKQSKTFKDMPVLYNGRLYPVESERKELVNEELRYNDYVNRCLIAFDTHSVEDKEDIQIDYTKGGIHLQSNKFNEIFGTSISTSHDDQTPFIVIKFLTRSIPESSIKDADEFDDVRRIDAVDLLNQSKSYRDLLEGILEEINELTSSDDFTSSDEIDQDMQAFNNLSSSIEDVKYSLEDLIDKLEKNNELVQFKIISIDKK